MKQRGGKVWNYFTYKPSENENSAHCKLCPYMLTWAKDVRTPSTIYSHLRDHHLKEYRDRIVEVKKEPENFPNHEFAYPEDQKPKLFIEGKVFVVNKLRKNANGSTIGYLYCMTDKCKATAKSEVVKDGENMVLVSYFNKHINECIGKLESNKGDRYFKLKRGRVKKDPLVENFPCVFCNIHSVTLTEAKEHFIKHNNGSEMFKCEKCNFKINILTLRDIAKVLNIHLKEDIILQYCTICSYKSCSTRSVGKHKSSQHNTNLACEYCDYIAKNISYLKVHIDALHLGVTYSCNICGKKYKQKTHLGIHMKSIHDGVKYPCDHCEYKASQRGHLKLHIKIVHLQQYFKCPFCTYKTSDKGRVKNHTEKVHDKTYV